MVSRRRTEDRVTGGAVARRVGYPLPWVNFLGLGFLYSATLTALLGREPGEEIT